MAAAADQEESGGPCLCIPTKAPPQKAPPPQPFLDSLPCKAPALVPAASSKAVSEGALQAASSKAISEVKTVLQAAASKAISLATSKASPQSLGLNSDTAPYVMSKAPPPLPQAPPPLPVAAPVPPCKAPPPKGIPCIAAPHGGPADLIPLAPVMPQSAFPPQSVGPLPVQGPSLLPPVRAAKQVWEAHVAPQGVPYYYCPETGESSWVRPSRPDDIVFEATSSTPAAPAVAADPVKEQLGEPESWQTIGKTGWLRVETEKGYSYFFHKKTKKTVWTCPDEIKAEVDKLDQVIGPSTGTEPPMPDPQGERPAPSKDEEVDGRGTEVVGGSSSSSSKPPKEEPESSSNKEKAEDQKARAMLRNFKQLLIEKGVKPFDKYEKWMPKLMYDPRFTAVPGQKQRKVLFETIAKKIDSERRKQTAAVKKGSREVFRELLARADEQGMLHDRPAMSVQKALEKHFGEEEAWDSVVGAERDRLIEEAVEASTNRRKRQRHNLGAEFRTLVLGMIRGKESNPPAWSSVRPKFKEDPKWDVMGSTSELERIYEQVVRATVAQHRKRLRQKAADQEAVQNLRQQKQLSDSEEQLMQLFAERVKSPFGITWPDAKKMLGDQLRLLNSALDEESQQDLWDVYKRNIADARCEAFILLLTNTPADVVSSDMDFDEALERLQAEGSLSTFQGVPEDVIRMAWEEWHTSALQESAQACQTWLRSSDALCGAEDVEPDTPAFEALLQQLKGDVRFQRLGARPEEQRRLVAERLEELRSAKRRKREEDEGGEDVMMSDDDDAPLPPPTKKPPGGPPQGKKPGGGGGGRQRR